MKLYFSIWAYCDPTRSGYDSIDVNYLKEKPTSNFAGVGQSENYEVEIPDTFSEEEAHEIGEKAEALMRKTKYYEPRVAVRVVLEGKDTI